MTGLDHRGSSTVQFPHSQSDSAMPGVSRILQGTRPWARMMGILGFVSVGLMLSVGVVAGAMGIATGDAQTAALIVVYPAVAVLYVFPSLYLLRYSQRIQEFALGGQQHQLEAALDAQRSFWKFIGIVSLASIGVLLLVLLIAVVVGIASVSGGGETFEFIYD